MRARARSQLASVARHLPHQCIVLAIESRSQRQRIDDGASVEKNVRFNIREALAFSPEALWLLQENGDVIVGVRARVASRPRTEQHDAFNPRAIGFIQRSAQASEDGISERVHIPRVPHSVWKSSIPARAAAPPPPRRARRRWRRAIARRA